VIAAAALYLSIEPFGAGGNPVADPGGTVARVPWTLHQNFVKRKARAIRIFITGGVCDQGPDRFDHADVQVTHSKIKIGAFMYSPPPKCGPCPALAVLIPALVQLPTRVGDRSIIDTDGDRRRWPPPGRMPHRDNGWVAYAPLER
jgi:hypothetical protein